MTATPRIVVLSRIGDQLTELMTTIRESLPAQPQPQPVLLRQVDGYMLADNGRLLPWPKL